MPGCGGVLHFFMDSFISVQPKAARGAHSKQQRVPGVTQEGLKTLVEHPVHGKAMGAPQRTHCHLLPPCCRHSGVPNFQGKERTETLLC